MISEHLAGGDCLNVGCVPSKALLRCARAASEVKRAAEFGLVLPEGAAPRVDFGRVMERMRRLRAHIAPADSHEGTNGAGADVSAGSLRVLVALFPDWPPVGAGRLLPPPLQLDATGRKGLLYWFEILFARPFPVFAGRMNAWVTWWAAQWLMGPWCADLCASNP